jgi:hypothetical protein
MRKILKPVCLLAAVMLTVSLMPGNAFAARRGGRCGNSCGSVCGNSCASSCGNSCRSSCGSACSASVAMPVGTIVAQPAGVAVPSVPTTGMNATGNRVQYQSAFQTPVNAAPAYVPATAPVYYSNAVPSGLPTNQVTRAMRRNITEYNLRADRKIGGL